MVSPTLPFPSPPFPFPLSFQTNQWEGRSDPVRGKFPGFPLQIPSWRQERRSREIGGLDLPKICRRSEYVLTRSLKCQILSLKTVVG